MTDKQCARLIRLVVNHSREERREYEALHPELAYMDFASFELFRLKTHIEELAFSLDSGHPCRYLYRTKKECGVKIMSLKGFEVP